MRKNLQLHRYLFLLFLLSLFGCAKNKVIVFTDNNATVEQVRFACGPACDASGFVIKTSNNELYTPLNLDTAFQINNLAVKIQFKKTGSNPAPYAAPAYELIMIERITK